MHLLAAEGQRNNGKDDHKLGLYQRELLSNHIYTSHAFSTIELKHLLWHTNITYTTTILITHVSEYLVRNRF